MKSESFLILHRLQRNYKFKALEGSEDIIKIVHVTSAVQP